MAKTKRPPPAPLDRFHKHFSSAAHWGERWMSLYAALLQPTRYVALNNKFAADGDFVTVMNQVDISEVELPARSHTRCYISQNADRDKLFPEPVRSSNGLNTHWNLDLASILAVRVLEVQPGDKVLDLCAAPGGKSIALAQHIFHTDAAQEQTSPGCLHSNEWDIQRMRRLDGNLDQYIPATLRQAKKSVCLQNNGIASGLVFPAGTAGYDKVLLDAPCSSERHILHAQDRIARSQPFKSADELTRWSPGLAKRLAETQLQLLQNALRSVRSGGKVLYATCSISKEENDDVVDNALRWAALRHEKNAIPWKCQLDQPSDVILASLDGWAERTRTGWIVLPDHETPYGTGWGPLFFSLLTKVKS